MPPPAPPQRHRPPRSRRRESHCGAQPFPLCRARGTTLDIPPPEVISGHSSKRGREPIYCRAQQRLDLPACGVEERTRIQFRCVVSERAARPPESAYTTAPRSYRFPIAIYRRPNELTDDQVNRGRRGGIVNKTETNATEAGRDGGYGRRRSPEPLGTCPVRSNRADRPMIEPTGHSATAVTQTQGQASGHRSRPLGRLARSASGVAGGERNSRNIGLYAWPETEPARTRCRRSGPRLRRATRRSTAASWDQFDLAAEPATFTVSARVVRLAGKGLFRQEGANQMGVRRDYR
ncbi:hypothetical protein DFR76_1095 [Nocardia pseudobrasiliensis]|uniref:Uncharacterized protein n=1 Tax=Nocardia pseudobrasiliensis TaxID=45979 RepID=A0A370I0F5_9NOCA|nr:hypothetical protein DFR76_1095 [Nocardia pseudobrasiliensis]